MSDYSKSYDGAAKDAAQSTVTGADFDTEFSSISTAIATKANKKVPTAAGNVATLSGTGDLGDSGVTSTELAILDGATISTTELNYLSGVTSNVQTQLDTVGGIRGCLVYHSSGTSVTSGAAEATILFDSESYDTDAIHSTVSSTGNLVVPSGVSKVRLSGQVSLPSDNYQVVIASIYKGATANYVGAAIQEELHDGSQTFALTLNLSTAIISVSPGDIFTLRIYQTNVGSTSVTTTNTQTWFAMEIIA